MPATSISNSFGRLEGRVRKALAVRGMADLLLALGTTGVVSFVLDWSLDIPWSVRALVAGRRAWRGRAAAAAHLRHARCHTDARCRFGRTVVSHGGGALT